MLIYGDRERQEEPAALLDGLFEAAGRLERIPAGLDQHSAAVSALIEAGGLTQGLADAAFSRSGCDTRDPAADLAMEVTHGFARLVAASWRGGCAKTQTPGKALARLRKADLPSEVTVRVCEGYAHYGVYPETYVEAAARAFPGAPPRVIGLRSIGTSLGAAAAAGAGSTAPISVRPVGDPFERELRLSPAVAAALKAPAPEGYAVVDEGPGLSGSSFGAVDEFLRAAGAPAEKIVFLPSHAGGPGAAAPTQRRRRWAQARRVHVDFDAAVRPRLIGWAERLTGPMCAQPADFSGGQWRTEVARQPAWPEQERRKYLLATEAGPVLLKFAGLGREGQATLFRAKALHGAGFTPEPLGLVHGFLAERWVEDAAPLNREGLNRDHWIDHLTRYLGFRARSLPAARNSGASLAELLAMTRRNLGLVGLWPMAERAAALPVKEATVHRVAIDGRLHAWEWLQRPNGQILKADALDHCAGHDLIGSQDIAWDVAGAAVEFGLSAGEMQRLGAGVAREAGRLIDPTLIAFMTSAYLAFQIGWWRMAALGCEGPRAEAEAKRYEEICRCGIPKP